MQHKGKSEAEKKHPELQSLRVEYRKVFEASLLGALVLVWLVIKFLGFADSTRGLNKPNVVINLDEVDLTQQTKRPPPPARPTIPIASENEDLLGDETIDDTEIDLEDIPPPPPPPPKSDGGDEPEFFIAYDTQPELVGGYDFIRKYLDYPTIARQAGMEGRVLVKVFIDEKGNVVDAVAIKTDGYSGFGQAAVAVVKKTKWKPARQRDKPVKVQIVIPITFRLK